MGSLAVLILIMAGCSAPEQQASQDGASPSPEATQSPTAAQPFDRPLVSAKAGDQGKKAAEESDLSKLNINKIPGLLQATDPDERAKQVQASISKKPLIDPFASLPPQLTFKAPIAPAGPQASVPSGSPGGALPGSEQPRSLPSLPAFPQSVEIRPPAIALKPPGQKPGTTKPGGQPDLKPLPPLPEPNLARAVEVTGVITMAGTTRAIVKAPEEPTSRYVAVGQRLSNGRVLVKRIEVNSGSDPIVILEENGVEVARAVGDKPKPPNGAVSG